MTGNAKSLRLNNGLLLYVRPDDGLVVVDGVPVFACVVTQSGEAVLRFCDDNKRRALCRGSRFIEVPLNSLLTLLDKPA